MNEPIPALGFPGYFEIPNFSRYAVNRLGLVINKKRAKVLGGCINGSGYQQYRIADDYNKVNTLGIHRILYAVFRGLREPLVTDQVINHLNGIKLDNDLENLELTTYQGNLEHAGAMGLTTKCIPIEVRDVDTGIVVKYPSATAYAKHHGLTKDQVLWRIRVGEKRVFPERKQYRKNHSNDPWYIPSKADERYGRSRRVEVRFVLTEVIFEFEKLSDLAKTLGFKMSYLFKHTDNPDQPVLPGMIQVKWSGDAEWREIGDPQLELDKTTGNKSVVVVNEITGQRKIFDSAAKCAIAFGLNKTTLAFRLKSDGGRLFDNHRFCYYSRAVNGPFSE